MKKKLIIALLILLFPLNVFAYSNYVIPGGNNIGIEVKNDGIIIIGFYKINNRLNNNDLKIGDVITKISDKEVFTIDDMVNTIEETVQDNKVRITVLRNKKEKTIQ